MNQKKINSINLNDIKKKIITFQITYKAKNKTMTNCEAEIFIPQ